MNKIVSAGRSVIGGQKTLDFAPLHGGVWRHDSQHRIENPLDQSGHLKQVSSSWILLPGSGFSLRRRFGSGGWSMLMTPGLDKMTSAINAELINDRRPTNHNDRIAAAAELVCELLTYFEWAWRSFYHFRGFQNFMALNKETHLQWPTNPSTLARRWSGVWPFVRRDAVIVLI